MEIKRIKAFVTKLTFKEPFTIAPGTAYFTENVIVVLELKGGVVGFGEACPSPRVNRETLDSNIEALKHLAPKLLDLNPFEIERIRDVFSEVPGNPSIKAALEMACWDALGKEVGRPVYQLIGGYRDRIETDITLSLKSPKEMAEDALKAVNMGFKVLKVKLGRDPAEDVKRVSAIREVVGEGVRIRVDVNEGWSFDEALRALPKLAEYGIELCEQPLKANDLEGLAKLRKEGLIPIMVDESVHDSKEALKVMSKGSADYINIKLMKCGGLSEALRIAYLAESFGLKCMIGCMGESEVGISAAVHLAQAVKNIALADLDSDILLADKLALEGAPTLMGGVRRGNGPGIGIMRLDESLLRPVGSWSR